MLQSNDSSDQSALAQHLARFAELDQKRLATVAAISPRVAQLASSFPLLFATLCQPYAPITDRRRVIALAVDGAPLPDIAAELALPLSLRRLPPESCPQLAHAAWSAHASRRLAPLIPVDAAAAKAWLSAVTFAHRYGDETIAIWIAQRASEFIASGASASTLRPLVLFAWHSIHRPYVVPYGPSWNPRLQFRSAVTRAVVWLKCVKLCADLGDGITDTWMAPSSAEAAYQVIPLTTPEALLEETDAMGHCAYEYGEKIALDRCRLYSVRLRGARVATLEVEPSPAGGPLQIIQLRGVGNESVSVEDHMLVNAHIKRADRGIRVVPLDGIVGAQDRFAAMMAPYRASRPRTVGVSETMSIRTLKTDLEFLAALVDVDVRWPRWH